MYWRDGVQLSERKHGEGVVKWVDRNNVILDRLWFQVEEVHESSGRMGIFRYHIHDGIVYKDRRFITRSMARLNYRPTE